MSLRADRELRREVESGLGGEGKIRILGALAENPNNHLTRYSLEKLTGLKSTDVRVHLKVLVRLKWVTEHPYQPRKYQINLENETVRHLVEFFRRVRYL
jgi:DNA-binding IclR family transcriptional regulator